MNIGIVIARIGGIDGVALETEKWMEVLERIGHSCRVLTGEIEGTWTGNADILPELAISHAGCRRGQEDAFFSQKIAEAELLERLKRESDHIDGKIRDWTGLRKIDVFTCDSATRS